MALTKKSFHVVFEGNIGSGKSTAIDFFNQFPEIEILTEPLSTWKNIGGANILEKSLKDPARWVAMFQSHVQLVRLKQATQALPENKTVRMLERCFFSNLYCYLEVHKDTITAPELAVLKEWSDWAMKNHDLNPDLIVYMRTDPDISYDRTIRRGREEKTTGVKVAYLKALHEKLENWLIHKNISGVVPPVLVIDANRDLDSVMNDCKKYADVIRGIVPFNQNGA